MMLERCVAKSRVLKFDMRVRTNGEKLFGGTVRKTQAHLRRDKGTDVYTASAQMQWPFCP